MNILHVINNLDTAGAEQLLCNMAVRMKGKGHFVQVATISGGATELSDRLKKGRIGVTSLLGPGRSVYDIRAVRKLAKLLAGYDVVHAHLFPTQYWVALARTMAPGRAAFVTTEHSTFNTRCRYRATTWTDRWVYGKFDAMACISEGVAEAMKPRVPRRTRLCVIQNGIDLQRFFKAQGHRAALLPDIPAGAFVLMQVARFRAEKDQDCVIRALASLPEDIHCVFVGDGERRAACEALARQCGVEQRTHFTGMRADVPELLSVCDIAVMSSHWEGFGLAAAEAMACRKPVLASDVEGLSQVVGDERLLFEAGISTELAKKILTLRRNSVLAAELSDRCREQASRFDVDKTAESYLELYESLLSSRKVQ